MQDGHHHHGTPQMTSIRKAFVIGITLNLAFVAVQVIVGLRIHSLSLLSDAGHNFLDVAGLFMALIAFRLAASKPTEKYTYGYKKASVLISLINAVVLLISIGAIGYESILRLNDPMPLPGKTIAIVSLLGIIINGGSALLFFRDKEKDINVKAAFLHLASDALVSIGLVVGGIIIHYTAMYWIDALLSILICIIIVVSTWALLKTSLKLSLDGVPENIDVDKIRSTILQAEGIKDVHHLHIWAMSTTQNAMTGHLLLADGMVPVKLKTIKEKLKHDLLHLNIHHATFETEYESYSCDEHCCQ